MEERRKNPYLGVDWENVRQITGCTHMHCVEDSDFREFISSGLEFATFANYYPATPWYPIREKRQNFYKISQTGFTRDGKYTYETVDYNKEIEKWKDTLSEKSQASLPFKEGGPVFSNIPDTLLEAPNAEHDSFTDLPLSTHICSLGSTFTSGNFDRFGEYGLSEHGFGFGSSMPWREGFKRILDALMIPDGGGITINHPNYTHLPIEYVYDMLDFDPRVLGIEIYNHNCNVWHTASSESMWDQILSTGRQCFGFCVQDHLMEDGWHGKSILLPDEPTAEGCLRAYRQGRFYGAIQGNGLRFEHISYDGETFRARTNRPVYFMLISHMGILAYENSTEFEYKVRQDLVNEHVYLRLTAREGRHEEMLYSQPIMLV